MTRTMKPLTDIQPNYPLPDGWRWVRLGEVGKFDSGGTPSKEDATYWEGDIPFVTGADITKFNVTAENARAFLTEAGLASGKTAVCKQGTVLFVTRTRVGRVGIADVTMGASQDLTPYTCGSEIIPVYVCWYLLSIEKILIANCRGATIQGLTREFIHSLPIPLAPLLEQQRIAALLTQKMAAVDAARAAAEAQLEAVKQLPVACLRAAFSGVTGEGFTKKANTVSERTSLRGTLADNPAVTSRFVKPGAPLPDGWRWVRVREVCEQKTGTRDPRKRPSDIFRYVDISGVDNKMKRISEARIISGQEAPSRARQVIRADDVIVSTTRPNLNAVARVPEELDNEICSTGFCVLRPKQGLDAAFLFGFVQSHQFVSTLSDLVKGALYPAVTDAQVLDQWIPLPPFSEQQNIAMLLAEKMAAINVVRGAVEYQLAAIDQLPSAFLREGFSGRL